MYLDDAFWYLQDDIFLKNEQPYYERNQILKKIGNSKAEFVLHFKKRYKSPNPSYRLLPPFWIAMELITFDQFLKIIDRLNYQAFSKSGKNVLDECAKKINAESFSELKNWLLIIKNIRNLACHNGRAWNSNYMVPKGLLGSKANNRKDLIVNKPHKIYSNLLIIFLLTKDTVIVGHTLKDDLIVLFNKYNTKIRNLEEQMGFHQGWHEEEIWN